MPASAATRAARHNLPEFPHRNTRMDSHPRYQCNREGGGMSPGDLQIWLNHFEHHALRPRRVPHGLADVLTPDELQLIASSIATFQLGEQSDGRTLLRAAERFARTDEMPHLVRIIDLLIREERRHASLLRAFMQDHRIPLQRSH